MVMVCDCARARACVCSRAQVTAREERTSFSHYATQLCAIVGPPYTGLSLAFTPSSTLRHSPQKAARAGDHDRGR